MSELPLTRRKTLLGAGAVGFVGFTGNAIASVDNGRNSAGQQEDQLGPALRVVHASPDTPSVEVRLSESDTAADPGDTGVGGGGTPDDGGETPADDEDDPLVEDLGFRDVSEYNEVEPGSYQLQVVATEDTGLIDELFGEDGDERVVFEEEVEIEEGTTYTAVAYGELARSDVGGGVSDGAGGTPAGGETPVGGQTPGGDGTIDDGETSLGDGTSAGGGTTGDGDVLVEGLSFGEHEYVEISGGDHTLEFRESAAAGGDTLGGETTPGDGLTTPGETTPGDEETTPSVDAGEDGLATPGGEDGLDTPGGTPDPIEATPGDGGATSPEDGSILGDGGAGGGDDRAFQVEVLEDELSVSGDGVAGDGIGTPTDGATPSDGLETPDGEGTPDDDGAGQADEDTSSLRVFHAVPDVDTLTVVSIDGDEEDGLTDGQGGTPAGQTPEEETPGDGVLGEDGGTTPGEDTGDGTGDGAGDRVQETEISPEGGVVYSGFALGYFDPDGGTVEGSEDGDGNVTDGEDGDDGLAEDAEGEEFEFVTVEDARDGERSEGGTGGGILPSMAAAQASSD